MNAAVVGQVAMSAVIGHALAGDKAYATLPMAIQMAATMAASLPAGFVFARLGRRPGFWLGCAGSVLGSLVFALGVWRGDFTVYCLGSVAAGLGFGIAQHYRFAAAEAAPLAARSRAIALVMTGGVVAALVGPEIVKRTGGLTGPYLFMGTYLVLACLPLVCAALLCFVRLPHAARRGGAATPIVTLLARPDFLVAVLAGLVAYGSMNLVMTSTPLEMLMCGFTVNDAADVIRVHAVAMYLPGFVTGRLIQRFGPHRLVGAGAGLTACCAVLSLAGSSRGMFMLALVFLGVGWNFMFTSATALLTRAHSLQERVRAQALNDFIVFGTVACTAFTSGVAHERAGWAALNLAVLPFLVVATGVVLWHRAAQARRNLGVPVA